MSEELDLNTMFERKNGVYVLRVRGDAMIEDHLCDGDYVVVERRDVAKDGDQVIALLDTGEATLRRYSKKDGMVTLKPANGKMPERVVEEGRVKVQGVVIGVLRSYA